MTCSTICNTVKVSNILSANLFLSVNISSIVFLTIGILHVPPIGKIKLMFPLDTLESLNTFSITDLNRGINRFKHSSSNSSSERITC